MKFIYFLTILLLFSNCLVLAQKAETNDSSIIKTTSPLRLTLSQKRIVQLNNGAVRLAFSHNLDRSQAVFNEARLQSPDNDTLIYNSALVAGQMKDYDRALGLLQNTGLGKRYLQNKGVWHAQLGNIETALKTWETASLNDTMCYNKALAYYRTNNLTESIDWSRRLGFSKNALFHELYANTLYRQKKYKEAEKFYEKSEKVEASPRLLIQRGNAHLVQRKFEAAELLFREYIEAGHSRNRFAARLGLGHALYSLHRYREAVIEYDLACRMNAQSAEAWAGLGNAHLGCGGQRQAQKAYERALALDSLRKDAWLGMAMVHYRLGAYDEAVCCFAEAGHTLNSKNKDHADFYAARGFCRLYNKQVKAAKPDIDTAVRLSTKTILPCMAMSEYLRMEGYYLSSLKWLEKAFKARGEGHERMYVNRGNLNLKCYQFDEAFDDFSMANQINPHNINALNGLGISWLHLDEIDKARAMYDSLLRQQSQAILWNNRGIVRSYLALREQQERNEKKANDLQLLSLQDFEKAMDVDSTKKAYHVNIGNVYKNQGQDIPALENYQKHLSKNAINNIGVMYGRGERKDFSAHYLNIAIDLDSANGIFRYNRAKLFHDNYRREYSKRPDMQHDFKRMPTKDISLKYSPDGFVTVFLFDYDFETFNFPGEPVFDVHPEPVDDFDFLASPDFVLMHLPQRLNDTQKEIVSEALHSAPLRYKPTRRRGQGSTRCPKII
jgi:tetratricopeptide (TPR) repeat protein